MDNDPVQTAARKAGREQRLGPNAHCALCGERNLEVLKSVSKRSRQARSIKRTLLERHHVCGKANDPGLTIALCSNCHAKANESQLREGVPLAPKEHVLDRMIGGHRGMAAFHREAAEAEDRKAEALARLGDQLDCQYREWRELPEEIK